MNTNHKNSVLLAALALALLALVSASAGTTHIVQFGGSFGFAYSPNNFNCLVGDSVKWTGVFSSHPLSSSTIPAGAAAWHAETGGTFTYAVKVAGTYHYVCDLHTGLGMVGQFTATATGVEQTPTADSPQSFGLDQNYPNPFNPATRIQFTLPETRHVLLKVHDMLGNTVATLVDGTQPSGNHSVSFDGSGLPGGIYFYTIESGSFKDVRRMVLLK
jgi:plastocyanin